MAIDETAARRSLDAERRRLMDALDLTEGDLAEERDGRDGELAAYDQLPADQGTETSDMERDVGLQADFERRLQENAAAQSRLDSGRYGTCEVCERPIGPARLEAMPSTRFCMDHANALEAGANAVVRRP